MTHIKKTFNNLPILIQQEIKNKYRHIHSNSDIFTKVVSQSVKSKKALLDNIDFLKKYELDYILIDYLPNLCNACTISKNFPELKGYVFLRDSKDDMINLLCNYKIMLINDPSIPYFQILNNQIFKDIFDTYITKNTLSSYINLVELGIIEKNTDLYNLLNPQNFEPAKKSLNTLIEAFLFTQDLRFLDVFNKIFTLTKSKEPNLNGVKISKLEEELKKTIYDSETKNAILELLQPNNDLIFTESTNIFTITIDIDKVNLFKNNTNKIDANEYISKMETVLSEAKRQNIKYCDSYKERTEDIDKIKHHSHHKLYNSPRILAETLKVFTFSYSSQSDMEMKIKMFKSFFNACLYIDTSKNNDVFIKQLNAIILNYSLEITLNESSSQEVKIKKNKI